jgi:hypothetical protein
MNIQSYEDFSLNEGLQWRDDLDFEFPCLLTQEDPDHFPCVQISRGEKEDTIKLWSKGGSIFHSFQISPQAYKILTQNPGPEQIIQIDPWSNWIRHPHNKEQVIEIREFLEEFDLEDDTTSPSEDLEMILDICDLNGVTVPYIDEIGHNMHLAKLSNGMESELEMTDSGLLKCFHIYANSESKKPLFTFDIIPSQKWTFHATEDPIVVMNGSLSSEKANIIKSLIRACLSEEISDSHKKNLISYYEQMLLDLSSLDRSETGRKNIDSKDAEIIRYKSLVSKYIGEKTAEELYQKAKQSLYHQK